MKTSVALLLLACASLVSAHADLVPPKPNVITVTNLAAFPKYKFSYRTEGQKETKPIPDGQAFSVRNTTHLLIRSGDGPEQQWEQIKYHWQGANVAVKVEAVKETNGTITVTSRTTAGDAGPGKKSTGAMLRMVPLFALTGIAACGLVLLASRRKVR